MEVTSDPGVETAKDARLGRFCGGLIGQPHQERSSLPIPPVLLLLTGEHLEEGDGEKNERTGSLGWVGTPGVFFCPLTTGVGVAPNTTHNTAVVVGGII